MRVPALRREDGAVAIMVALLTVALVVTAAFSVDFGRAYVAKRTLSTGADAAVIAAARYFALQQGSCTTLSDPADPNYAARIAAAQAAAVAQLSSNDPLATAGTVTVQCAPPDNKALLVSFDDSRSVDTVLGKAAGVGKIGTARAATASVFVPLNGNAVPYMVCVADANILRQNPNTVQKVVYPGGCGDYGGDWYTIDCPEDAGNTSQNNLAKFCQTPVSVIETVPADTDNPVTELQLKATCENQPYSATPGCLRGNSGNISGSQLIGFWDGLLGKTILMPVIYPNTSSGKSAGSQIHFPVAGFIGAEVCGYHWGSKHAQWLSDRCAGTSLDVADGGSDERYALFVFSNYLSSGTAGGPSGCAIGASCDTGNRGVGLVK